MSNPSHRAADVALLLGATLLILMPAADTWLHLDPTTPAQEKRELAPSPSVSGSTAEWTAFPRAFDRWLSDHVGLRNTLLAVDSRIKVQLLGTPPGPAVEVLIGRHGWLYYTGGYGLEYAQRTNPLSARDLHRWCQVMEARQQWLAARGIRFLFVLAPNKETVYPEHLPQWLRGMERPSRADQLLGALRDRTGVVVLDLRPVLLEARKEHRVFSITDSHWSSVGAHRAYQAIMEQLGTWFPAARPHPLRDFAQVKAPFSGDLATMLGASSYLREEGIKLRPRRGWTARFELAPEYATLRPWAPSYRPVRSKKRGSAIGRVVMIRDSFGEALKRLLAEHIGSCVYLWLDVGFPTELIEKERPDVVILELVERQLSIYPPKNPPLPPDDVTAVRRRAGNSSPPSVGPLLGPLRALAGGRERRAGAAAAR